MLKLVAEPECIDGAQYLHADISEFYLSQFPQGDQILKIAYVAPARFGCEEEAPYLEKEVRLQAVRNEIDARKRRRQLPVVLERRTGFELASVEKKDGGNLEVTLRLRSQQEPGDKHRSLLRTVASDVLRCYRLSERGRLTVRLLPARVKGAGERAERAETGAAETGAETPVEDPVLAEATFDSHAREISVSP
jgi:hypothetical protein